MENLAMFTFSSATWADNTQTSAHVICDQLGEVTVGAENGGHVWSDFLLAFESGLEVGGYVIPQPTTQDVNAERDRRVQSGFAFGGKLFDFSDEAKARISGAATLAGFALGAGSPDGYLRWHQGTDDFAWIAADNSLMTMDAKTCFAFGQTAATHDSKHVFAARELKNMEPIPADYTDDKWWP